MYIKSSLNIFEPFIRVGDFYLGKNISFYTDKIADFTFKPKEYLNDWDEYDFYEGKIELYVNKEKIITSIASRKELIYNEKNLIGYNINSFLNEHIYSTHEKLWISNNEEQDVYDFDDLGLQLWVNQSGLIVTAFVSEKVNENY